MLDHGGRVQTSRQGDHPAYVRLDPVHVVNAQDPEVAQSHARHTAVNEEARIGAVFVFVSHTCVGFAWRWRGAICLRI